MRSSKSALASLVLATVAVWLGGPARVRAQSMQPTTSSRSLSASPATALQAVQNPVPTEAVPALSAADPSHPPVAPAGMQPAEAQALLYKIYAANFHVGDVTGALGIDQGKLGDQDRASLSQKAEALRASVATVEKARSDFYNHPDDPTLGQATTSSIHSLLPKIDEFAATLRSTPGANAAEDYQQAASDLRSLDAKLEPYVAYLEAKSQPGGAIETEVIKPTAAPPPLTVTAPEKSPLSADELKALLYQAYVPAFRIKDLLGQEHPEHWKAPDAERTVYNDAFQALTKRLGDLANWRDQLEARPDSLEAAFEVYAALDKISEPADIVGQVVTQYGEATVGPEYLEKARQVTEFRNQIEPYVGYLLRRHDQAVGTVERNFVACETELTAVMRPTTPTALAMNNVLPAFKGRGKTVIRGATHHNSSTHTNNKTSSPKPASSGT